MEAVGESMLCYTTTARARLRVMFIPCPSGALSRSVGSHYNNFCCVIDEMDHLRVLEQQWHAEDVLR